MNGMPKHVERGGSLADVYLAARDHGAQSVDQIAARCGLSGPQAAPVVWMLCAMGWLAPVGRGLARMYCNARLAPSMNGAIR